MKSKNLQKLRLFALAASLAASGAWAEDSFTCGTPDGIASPLAKSSDLPRVSKVWNGKLKALILRVGFSDAAYAVDTATIGKTNTTINNLYRAMSRNTFEWDWKIHPTILVAPGTRAQYGASFTSLQSWITQQITAAGLKRGTDYDVYIANFPQIAVSWGGLSNMRDADWINGSYSAGVTAHELGHSVGLPHAHSVEAGTDMFGTPGNADQTNEYGNPFDVMGRGGSSGHFNVLYKWRVGWADAAEVKEVKSSGTYRIYAQDNGAHKDRVIGIKVPSGNAAYAYWFEYRTISTSARAGASVMFQGFQTATNLDSWYLDATPASRTSNDENDGVLAVGKQFKDKYGEATFKTLAINTGVTNEEGWVDIEVVIPGTVTPLARPEFTLKEGLSGNASYFDMMGRSVTGLSRKRTLSIQPMAVREKNRRPGLVLDLE